MTPRVIRTLAIAGAMALLASCNSDGAEAAEGMGMSKLEEKESRDHVVKTDAEWREILTEEEFRIARKKGTERAFTGKYWNHKEEGVYICVCCSQDLFESETKFKSGTGWPSFYAPTSSKSIREERDTDLGMVRTEVLCSRCDAHLGHVFEDGPKPTGLRYCVNSASLRFVAEADRKEVVTKTAMFGAGCFWGVEWHFRKLDGVVETAVGYSGGSTENPTYREVCTDRTGHAEVVQVMYDPTRTSYEDLLAVFWNRHDPTQLNRQGPDVGTQYRSVIFTYDEEQRRAAQASKAALEKSGKFSRKIVTEISPAPEFYRAEEYHQRYYEKKGVEPTCDVPTGSGTSR